VQHSKLSELRKETLTNSGIDALSSVLEKSALAGKRNVFMTRTWKSLLDGAVALEADGKMGATTDGLHYEPKVVGATADLLLNHMCNRVVLSGVNLKSTVCGAGGGWNGGQVVSILVLLGLGVAGYLGMLCVLSFVDDCSD
jgi:hypothetical protein